MKRNQSLFVGILAGIAAGLMVLAAFNAGVAAFLLFFAAPAAIYIASMGWGRVAAITSVITAAILAAYFGGSAVSVLTTALLFAPAGYVGHLTNLGQRADIGSGIVWFPLSTILLHLMIILAVGFVVVGVISGYSPELFSQAFVGLMKDIASARPDLPQIPDEELMARAGVYAKMIPIIVPSLWLLLHVATAFVAASITRRSGLLARDEEDIAATINLPIEASGIMAAGLIGTYFLSGAFSQIAGVLLGVSIAGFGLIGLAQLHYRTRPMPSRGFILGIAYGAIILFSVPLLIFTVMGLVRSFTQNRSGPSGPSPSNTNSNSE